MKTKQLYYLQCVTRGYVGNSPLNSPLFWAKGGSGYTTNLDEAEQFTAEQVRKIVSSTRGSHKWRRFEVTKLDSIAHRVVDMQELHKILPKKKTSTAQAK
jgi:hypothetical protein